MPNKFDSPLNRFNSLIDSLYLIMLGASLPIFIVYFKLFEFQSQFQSEEYLCCIRDFPTGPKVHFFPFVKQLFIGELYQVAILRIMNMNQDFFGQQQEQNFLFIIINQPRAFFNWVTRGYFKFKEQDNFRQKSLNLYQFIYVRFHSVMDFIPEKVQFLLLLL